ncbi:monoacylglycerol lipase ABHD6-like [Glandiceps talaboti]
MSSLAVAIAGSFVSLVGSMAAASALVFYFKPVVIVKLFVRYNFFKLGMSIKYQKAGDMTFCYAERGKGKSNKPSMLFLHGFSGSKDMWTPALKALPNDLHIVCVDMPGHGDTTRKLKVDYTLVSQAEKIHQFVESYGLNKSPFHIIGISMGGGVAGVYAALYPKDLAKLTLFCPIGINSSQASQYAQDMMKDPREIPLPQTPEEIKNMSKYIMYQCPEMPGWFYKLIAAVRRPDIEFFQRVVEDIHVPSDALETRLSNIKTPTLVIWGQYDKLVDISGLDIIKQDLKSVERVEILDKCGHSIAIERPYRSAKILMEFINS